MGRKYYWENIAISLWEKAKRYKTNKKRETHFLLEKIRMCEIPLEQLVSFLKCFPGLPSLNLPVKYMIS